VSRLAPDFADFRFLGQAATLFDALYAPPPRRGVIVVTRHDFDAAIRRSNVRAQTLWPAYAARCSSVNYRAVADRAEWLPAAGFEEVGGNAAV